MIPSASRRSRRAVTTRTAWSPRPSPRVLSGGRTPRPRGGIGGGSETGVPASRILTPPFGGSPQRLLKNSIQRRQSAEKARRARRVARRAGPRIRLCAEC